MNLNDSLYEKGKIIKIYLNDDDECSVKLLLQNYFHIKADDNYKIKKYETAIEFLRKETALIKNSICFNDSIKNENLYLLGAVFHKLGFDDKALVFLRNTLYNKDVSGKIYSLIGYIYKVQGKLNSSILFYNKAIYVYEQSSDFIGVFREKSRLASTYLHFNDSINCRKGLSVLFPLLENITETNYLLLDSKRLFIVYSTLGSLYRGVGDINNSKKYYFEALKVAKKNNNRKSFVFVNLAELYRNTDFEKSLRYYKQSLKYSSKYANDINISIGVIYYLKQDYTKALSYYDKTLKSIFGKNFIANKDTPTFNDVDNYKNHIQLERLFNEIVYSYVRLYENTKDNILLKQSIAFIKLQDYTYDLILQGINDYKSKLYWQSRVAAFYASSIESCYLARDNELAFYFMEKNKAFLLLMESVEKKLRMDSRLPKELYVIEESYRKAIILASKELRKVEDSYKSEYYNRLFNKKIKYSFFIDSISKIYPNFKISKYKLPIIKLNEVKDDILDKNSLLISYMWNNITDDFDALYCMVTSQQTSKIYKIKGLKDFKETLNSYKKYTLKPFTNTTDEIEFKKISYKLFKKLFPSDELRELIKGKKLIIIPDNDIQNIPFEALITKENTLNYLINNSDIIYEYSMSFLEQNKKYRRESKYDFLGFAPINFSDLDLETLYHSKEEVSDISDFVYGKVYLDEDATKINFLKEINNTKIIHLATHADSNETIVPWIAFKDEKLYLDELYFADNKAELAVLSACNTSTGEIISGEGIMSLARGFFYSGTNSVISSLWATDDKSTVSIITDFYKYLKYNNTKSYALRKSKLNYLKNHNGSELSPYYWANLILIGSDAQLKLNETDNNLYYYLSLILIVIISWIYFRRFFYKL